ncbi:phage antirepressor KilAC domain-containing protein [Kozakia baliensis]|uniref:phage antirepressor KilAC domain-containing protein n=1 Tax=Kozakia baliensis TaxID=153496 RepID=UPI00345BBCCD
MSHSLIILGTEIRQDADGRYSLGDCWQLSGKADKDRPTKWYEAEKTQEFLRAIVGETENSLTLEGHREAPITPVSVVKAGPNDGRGYWGSREAVLHYATWISADFYLKVIRAFDALVLGNHAPQPAPMDDTLIVARAFQITHQQLETLKAENAILVPKADGYDRLSNAKGRTNLREVGKELKIGSQRGIEFMREIGWIFRDNRGKWKAYSSTVDAGYVEMKYATFTNSAGEEVATQQVFVTPRGMTRLDARLNQH